MIVVKIMSVTMQNIYFLLYQLIIMEQIYNLVKYHLGDDYLKAYDEIETV